MRDRMERLVILPFSVGCISEASVAVGIPQPRKSSNSAPIIRCKGLEEDIESRLTSSSSSSAESVMKNNNNIPKSSSTISTGINRFLKGFKNFSHQFFVEKDDEEEMEMEIGSPRDVQHVTHIGWDGTATANIPIMGWDNLIPPSSFQHHYELILSKPPQTSPRPL